MNFKFISFEFSKMVEDIIEFMNFALVKLQFLNRTPRIRQSSKVESYKLQNLNFEPINEVLVNLLPEKFDL